MKIQRILKPVVNRATFLVTIGATMFVLAPASWAGLVGPYTVDSSTLHLWHMDEPNGTPDNAPTNGLVFDAVTANPQTSPIVLSNVPGPDNFFINTVETNFTFLGEPGFAITNAFVSSDIINYGTCAMMASSNRVQAAGHTCLYVPWANNGAGLPVSGTNSSDYINTNTGAFTFEAMIKPYVDLLNAQDVGNFPEIICGDGGPFVPERAFQFRFNPANGGELEFNNIQGTGTHDVFAPLPHSGPDVPIVGKWYHVAITYTGDSPTNGDPAHVFKFYWTLVDPSKTNADLLFTTNLTSTLTTSKVCLCIGGSARGSIISNVAQGGGFQGFIDEVRISDVCRKADEMVFTNTFWPSSPTLTPVQTNAFIGYGHMLSLAVAETGSNPITNQWFQISGGVTNALAGQTNSTLIIGNVTFGADGNYQLRASNPYGSTNTVLIPVTIGAGFQKLFNTGVDSNGVSVASSNASFDQHWLLTQSPDPNAQIPRALVWKLPLLGAIAFADPYSSWIGASSEHTGGPYGTATYQTSFEVDEGPAGSAALNGNLYVSDVTPGSVVQVFLNGVETDITLSAVPAPWLGITPFTITNGLQVGTNTISFTYSTSFQNPDYPGFRATLDGIGPAYSPGLPTINVPPASRTVLYGDTASLSVVGLGRPPLSYQWLSNNVPIAGAVGPDLSFVATNFANTELVGGQFTADYQAVVGNDSGYVTSSVAALTIQIPPLAITSAGLPIWNPTNNEANVIVAFSAPVDPVTAATAGNYSLDGGANVLSAALVAPNEVALTTSILNPADTYHLTVQNVEDAFGITMPSTNLLVGTYPANIALWVKADSGVTTNYDGTVYQWNDLSGNGNDLYQASAPPLLATNALGQPVIRFNGANLTQMYANDSPSLEITNDMSIFAVVNFATLDGGTNGLIVCKDSGNQPASYDYYASSTNTIRFLRGNGSANAALNSSSGPSIGTDHLLDVVMQGVNVTHRLDGRFNGSGALSTTIADTTQPLFIGARADGGNRLTGDLAELILVGSALSSNDVASIEDYLAAKHGVTIQGAGFKVSLGPPALTLYAGQNVTLSATATGTLPFHYQWLANGTAVPNATNSTYTLAVPLGSSSVNCTVSNAFNGYSVTNAGPVSLIGVAAPTNAFSQMVLSDGPIAYWRLNEPQGSTVAYDYVSGYNGTYGPNTTNGLPGAPLAGGSAELSVAMDNSVATPGAGYVTTPGVNLNANAVTFLCWAYPFATPANSAGLVFYRVGSVVAGCQFANGGAISYNWNNNSATYNYNSGLVVPPDIWSLVAVTITPSNAVLYVANTNGQASATNYIANASLSFGSAGFALGADPQPSTLPARIFDGKMDEVAIFNYTLSASQLNQLYSAAVPTGINTAPTNILVSVAANHQITLSWPLDHTGWLLQSNSVGLTATGAWFTVSGSAATNRMTVTPDATRSNVFYRLFYQPQ